MAELNQYKSLTKRRYKNLEIDGEKFRIQSLTAREWRAVNRKVEGSKDRDSDYAALMIVNCLVDSDGNRVFQDADSGIVADWDTSVQVPLSLSCTEHCGLNRTLEDAVKNLDETPTPSST